MRRRTWLLILAAVACAGPPQEEEPPPAEPQEAAVPSVNPLEQRLDELLAEVGRDFTSREKTVDLSNTISRVQEELTSIRAELHQVGVLAEEAHDANPATSRLIQQRLDALDGTAATLLERMAEAESDIGLAMGDSHDLREEIREVLQGLRSYRDAYRSALEIRRDSLRQELDLLEELLRMSSDQGEAAEGTGSP